MSRYTITRTDRDGYSDSADVDSLQDVVSELGRAGCSECELEDVYAFPPAVTVTYRHFRGGRIRVYATANGNITPASWGRLESLIY